MPQLPALLAQASEATDPSVFLSIVMILGGLFFLSVGGESLVSGASRLALRLRLTPTVIGLTVVAAGTSLPELVVSLIAQVKGSAELAVGNVIGSNIFNIGMVLGVLALFRVLPIPGSTARLEFPFLIGTTFAVLLLGQGGDSGADGLFTRLEGLGMLAFLVVFIGITIRVARGHVTAAEEAALTEEVTQVSGIEVAPTIPLAWMLGQVALGAAGLWLGGELLVKGAVGVATVFQIPERIIALTVVAGGTGAPELVASIIAVRRGKGEMAVGNVIGSNLFNLLAIIGFTSAVSPLPAPAAILNWDLYWMLGITLLLIPFFFRSDPRIRRLEGGLILLTYLTYLGFLIARG